MEEDNSKFFPLLALPDDILLLVFEYVDPRDLFNLSRSCERLNAVARYPKLWSKVDLRKQYMMLCQLKEFAEYFHPKTKLIASRGCVYFIKESIQHSQNCSSDVSKVISQSCPNLETLILEEHYFDPQKITVYHFPSSLKSLTLKDCEVFSESVRGPYSFLGGINHFMPHLEVLILEGCEWITHSCFLHISRCPNLKELRMISFPKHRYNFICIAFAVFTGFKSLKILDVQETFVSEAEFLLLAQIPSLTHLRVECRCSSNVNKAESVKNCEEASREAGRASQLPAGVTCSCRHPAAPADSQEAMKYPVESTARWVAENPWMWMWLNDQPERIDPKRHISDWSVARLGTDFKDMVETAFRDDIIPVDFNHHLTHLEIKNFKGVTDKSLGYLSKMRSLKYLNVRGTSVTHNGKSSFCAERPDVNLESDYGLDIISKTK